MSQKSSVTQRPQSVPGALTLDTPLPGISGGDLQRSARLIQAKSRFALINTDVETRSIQLGEAARKLEALAFSWRGDAFEFDLNRRLGDIYADMGDYRASLSRLRSAASHFKDVEGAEAIAEDMRKRFRELFWKAVPTSWNPYGRWRSTKSSGS